MKPSDALKIPALQTLMGRYGLPNPRVFGSVLTVTDDEDSNLGRLVNAGQATTLSPSKMPKR